MTEEKRQALREFTEAQQRANRAQREAAEAREKAGLPEWD